MLEFRPADSANAPLQAHFERYPDAYVLGPGEGVIDGLRYVLLDGVEVGAVWESPDQVYVGYLHVQIAVYEPYARQGLGRRILDRLLNAAHPAGIRGYSAVVQEGNLRRDRIVGMLTECGFELDEAGMTYLYDIPPAAL